MGKSIWASPTNRKADRQSPSSGSYASSTNARNRRDRPEIRSAALHHPANALKRIESHTSLVDDVLATHQRGCLSPCPKLAGARLELQEAGGQESAQALSNHRQRNRSSYVVSSELQAGSAPNCAVLEILSACGSALTMLGEACSPIEAVVEGDTSEFHVQSLSGLLEVAPARAAAEVRHRRVNAH